MYRIEIVPSAAKELREIPSYHRKSVEDAIEDKLLHEPSRQTKNRKCLKSFVPSFAHAQPVWELREGEWRIFYDVDEDEKNVVIRAIRKKPSGLTTEDIA